MTYRMPILLGSLLLCATLAAAQTWQKQPPSNAPIHAHPFDLCVYGGTAAGVVAAAQARRMGLTAVIVEPGRHLGGLSSGGLGATDTGTREAIGGLSRQFYSELQQHYADTYGGDSEQVKACSNGFRFEPHVAEQTFDRWAREMGIVVYRERWLERVVMRSGRIHELVFDDSLRIRAGMFVDCTYEGDLLAAAGVSFTVGREANAVYGETINGAQPGRPTHQFRTPVDPYLDPGDPNSGLLPGVSPGALPELGAGDERVQAYNFRMCLTRDRANQIPFPKPRNYDTMRYQLLARYVQGGQREGMGSSVPMPNGKTDTNNSGGFSTDNIGMNYAWPTGDRATRERIYQDHLDYQQGLMYFLTHDEAVPEEYRRAVGEWGLAADEFRETGGWPHQLYVREGRRMVSDYVMTELDCRSTRICDDPIGLASYNMDSHHVQRLAVSGRSENEGDVQVGVPKPYPISYRSIVPPRGQCRNLLVPVCLSCSHIAYGSIRMEPVFMILAQSAATAAAMALDSNLAVQDVPYARLRERLVADGQILEWTGPARPPAEEVSEIKPESLPGIVLDDRQGRSRGTWIGSASSSSRRVGFSYVHDDNTNKGLCSIAFTPDLPAAGPYEIRIPYWEHANRATNVPITIHAVGRPEQTVHLNQRLAPPDGWAPIGVFDLPAGAGTTVTISNAETDGYVVVDGIQFLPQSKAAPAVVPLPSAHAHNDYRHQRPLLDALDHGFCSVEADIHLIDGELLVAHDRDECTPERTLCALYLEPLAERTRAAGGAVYGNRAEFTLWIDIKAEPEAVWPVLREQLNEYVPMLTAWDRGERKPGAVTVVLTGAVPLSALAAEEQRLATGSVDIAVANPPEASVAAALTASWSGQFAWRGDGAMPEAERAKLHQQVAAAHAGQRRIRYWGVPHRESVWDELRAARADWINADDLPRLQAYLTARH